MAGAAATLRLGSRGSALARWQAGEVQRRLAACGCDCQIEILETTGDRRTDVVLAEIGGKGLFTQEIEAALLAEELDLAVHSLKDVPTVVPAGLALVAMLERADARDALVAAPGMTLERLPHGARIGSSSLRRQAQALALRPDVRIEAIRGNVDTRLRRWRAGEFDALFLATAGLERLGLAGAIAERLEVERFCPAAGQGVLAIECRADDAPTIEMARRLHHAPTGAAVRAERALLGHLQCGCQAPVGAYARIEKEELRLSAVVASRDGRRVVRREGRVRDWESAEILGVEIGEALLEEGAAEILGEIDL